MKKTKNNLVYFVRDVLDQWSLHSLGEVVAEKLIKGGWIELDEPREFQVYYDKSTGNIRPYRGPGAQARNEEIIHVREVMDDE